MPKHAHARRRIQERLGLPPTAIPHIVKALRETHGYATSAKTGVRAHFITYQGQRLKAVFDWRKHRLVTVIPLSTQEANGSD